MRLFADAGCIGDKYIKITDQGDIRHLSKVLRLREGDEIDVSDSMEWGVSSGDCPHRRRGSASGYPR